MAYCVIVDKIVWRLALMNINPDFAIAKFGIKGRYNEKDICKIRTENLPGNNRV